MRRQTIFVNEHGETRLHTSGFSWFAALAFPVWALQHKLYRAALASAVLSGAWNVAAWKVRPEDGTTGWLDFTSLPLLTALGFLAGWVHAWLLKRDGYREIAREPDEQKGANKTAKAGT
jgi:hypothetical protein